MLYRSIVKYGVENHIFEVIEQCDIEDLNCRERHWQDFYEVLNGGLNCKLTQCGSLKYQHSDEVKNKIAESMKGLHSGNKNPMFGKTPWLGKNHTDESKEKISKTKKKRVINLTTLIIHPSYKEVSKIVGIGESCMRAKLNGQNPNNTEYQYLEDFIKTNPDFKTLTNI